MDESVFGCVSPSVSRPRATKFRDASASHSRSRSWMRLLTASKPPELARTAAVIMSLSASSNADAVRTSILLVAAAISSKRSICEAHVSLAARASGD